MRSSVLIWNRLEPQPQSNDLSVALRCEVRDALWMLARQWQMGEFGPKTLERARLSKCNVTVFSRKSCRFAVQNREPFPPKHRLIFSEGIPPLENHSPSEGKPPTLSLDLRVEFGRYWLQLKDSIACGNGARRNQKIQRHSTTAFQGAGCCNHRRASDPRCHAR